MPVQSRNGAAESQSWNNDSYPGMISIHAMSCRLSRGEKLRGRREHVVGRQQFHAGVIGRANAQLARATWDLFLQIDFLVEIRARPVDERRTKQRHDGPI